MRMGKHKRKKKNKTRSAGKKSRHVPFTAATLLRPHKFHEAVAKRCKTIGQFSTLSCVISSHFIISHYAAPPPTKVVLTRVTRCADGANGFTARPVAASVSR